MPLIAAYALFHAISVSYAAVCHSLAEQRCQEPGREFFADIGSLTFVTTIEGLRPGQVVHHVWRKGDRHVHSERLKLGSSPSHVHSSCTIRPNDVGRWTAAVIGPDGKALSQVEFEIRPVTKPKKRPLEPQPLPYRPPIEEKQ